MIIISYFMAAFGLGWCVSASFLYFKRLSEVST